MGLCDIVIFVAPNNKYIMGPYSLYVGFIRFYVVYVCQHEYVCCVPVCRYVCLCEHRGRQKGTLDTLELQLQTMALPDGLWSSWSHSRSLNHWPISPSPMCESSFLYCTVIFSLYFSAWMLPFPSIQIKNVHLPAKTRLAQYGPTADSPSGHDVCPCQS